MRILSTFYSSCLLTILPLLLLSSCSWDNLNSRNKRKENNSSNTTVVAFELSDKGGASTYALDGDDDSAVSEIHILLFNTRNQLIDATPRLGTLTTINGKVEVKTTLTTLPYGNIVLLANASTILSGVVFTEGMTYSDAMDLLQLNLSDKWNAKKGSGGYMDMPMYGETGYVDVRINNNVFATNLIRMLCRVDVNLTDKALINFKLTSVRVYNREKRGMLAPSKVAGKPAMPAIPSKDTTTPLVYDNKNDKTEIAADSMSTQGEIFLMESLVANELDDKARLADALCLVVGGIYDGEECFYRVDFAMDDTGTEAPYPKHFYNPLRNHHYQINITAVLGAGEEKPDEAFKKETALIKVDVLDWGKGGAIDGDIDGEHVLRLSQGEFNLPTPAHTAGSVGNKLTVSSTHPEGWYIEKITKEDGTTTSDWLSVDLSTPGSPQMTYKMFSLILSENEETAARVGYIFIKSGSRMVYKVKVTQLPEVRIRKIVWDDYDGISDGDTELTTLVVELADGSELTSTIKAGGVVDPSMTLEALSKVTVTYMGYVLEVPDKYSYDRPTQTLTITDRSLIGKPVHLDKIRLDLTGNYLQIRDVDLAGYTSTAPGGTLDNWVPIGFNTPATAQFSGSYDGGSGNGDTGFTISNLNIAMGRMSNYTGLFGYASATSVLTKIHIATGSIKGEGYVGSICGVSEGSISNSSNEAAVTASLTGSNYIGGIAGQGHYISSCTNNATVAGTNYTGGICGYQTGTPETSKIINCHNLAGGIITTSLLGNICAGGVVGLSEGIISGCSNAVPVKGRSYVGGICGKNVGTIEFCENTATVETTTETSDSFAGGIVGSGINIENCNNIGVVTSTGHYVGGIAGQIVGIDAIIANCKNLLGGNIEAIQANYVGGIAGDHQGTTDVIVCTNAGNVTGKHYVGGLFGDSYAIIGVGNTSTGTVKGVSFAGNICGNNLGTISGITNDINITGTGGQIGGIAGANSGTVEDCTNIASVSGSETAYYDTSSQIGGIVGHSYTADSKIINCHNTGTISGAAKDIGGICGRHVGTGNVGICTNSGNINVRGNETTTNVQINMGGLFGYSAATISDPGNKSTGVITGTDGVGNICGENKGTISGITNNTPITGTGTSTGGIAGVNSGTISGCINNTTVAGTGAASFFVGGIAGNVSAGGVVTNCENSSVGIVTNTGAATGGICGASAGATSECINRGSVNGVGGTGGICGQSGTASEIVNCHNAAGAKISGTGDYIGGICGRHEGTGDVGVCTNAATVTGYSYVGGLFGRSAATISAGNTSTGTVTGRGNIGNICGENLGTISGITNKTPITSEGNGIGGIVGRNWATIKDCTNTAPISGTGPSPAYVSGNIGGIVGISYDTSVMYNCHNTATISGEGGTYVGGIAGSHQGTTDVGVCTNAAPVTGKDYVGGLFGRSAATISGAVGNKSTGTVTGVSYVGSICGENSGTISGITNNISITATGSYIGGIAGRSLGGTIIGCINNATVTGTGAYSDYVGGITGYAESDATITRCENKATVSVTNYGTCTGGVAGENRGEISNCINRASVKGGHKNIGGIIGYNSRGVVSSSYNIGAVTGNAGATYLGAIIGWPTASVNCYFGGAADFAPTTAIKKFGLATTTTGWPTAALGWDVAIWNLGSWNGGVNPTYPSLKPYVPSR